MTQEHPQLTPPYVDELMTPLFSCALVLPSQMYRSSFLNFPATNCTPRWGTHGDFYSTISYFEDGKKQAEVALQHCTESGYLHAEADDLRDLIGGEINGIMLMESRHTKEIPLDMYMFHTHRETGAYISYPIATFMGDLLYTKGHSLHMENTHFWPGVVSNLTSESCVAIMNPFNVTMSYQLSLFLSSGERRQSGVLKTKSRRYSIHHLEEYFPDILGVSNQAQEQTSLCITAQYKLASYFMIRNRATGVFTTIDHTHQYCLF